MRMDWMRAIFTGCMSASALEGLREGHNLIRSLWSRLCKSL